LNNFWCVLNYLTMSTDHKRRKFEVEPSCSDVMTHFDIRCQNEHCTHPLYPSVDEIMDDLSRAVDDPNIRETISDLMSGLFGGTPKHSNLYYVIVHRYDKVIPSWFAKKYDDVEPGWDCFIEHLK
jgi:predicted GTPase